MGHSADTEKPRTEGAGAEDTKIRPGDGASPLIGANREPGAATDATLANADRERFKGNAKKRMTPREKWIFAGILFLVMPLMLKFPVVLGLFFLVVGIFALVRKHYPIAVAFAIIAVLILLFWQR